MKACLRVKAKIHYCLSQILRNKQDFPFVLGYTDPPPPIFPSLTGFSVKRHLKKNQIVSLSLRSKAFLSAGFETIPPCII